MKRNVIFFLVFTSFALALSASPKATRSPKRTLSKSEKNRQNHNGVPTEIALSANGWSYVNGEWVHPEGYKYANGKVLRTTARAGRTVPKPPGKLALDNAQKVASKTGSAPANVKTEAEKKAEERRKNLTPRAAPQTGTYL